MKKLELSKTTKENLTGYAFILPNVVGVCAFTLLPMIFSLVTSFTDWDYTRGFGKWNFIGVKNYLDMWKDGWFTSALTNTIFFAFIVVPATIVISLILSVIIDKYCYGKVALRLAMFMPYISNIVAVSIVWVMMYSPWGPFTQLMETLGIENPPQWLGNERWALPAIMIMTVWGGVGYAIMIYTSSIQGLPADVYEAADIDGANEVQKFFKLTIHFLSPTTFFLVITTFITCFQVFAQVQIMTKGGPGSSSNVLVYYIYTSAFSFYKMGYASAMSWILFIILFIITIIQWRGQKKWVNY
ncbi:carbohydrate ABC transporter permease [Kineothrix sp. MB12-C1]|uniref:carbohydrate ABC transporter permease n=1 Tax=Kineothrix sp. MB12-C1 TaxID=3070215 RepID=UPI0027D24E4D|nr:sugar ABC transporter permease [Kineothrix sp. MB12-C1]WMC92365.1 sugar ABC transporter permease [Kineothrix sp. MB12-C1]